MYSFEDLGVSTERFLFIYLLLVTTVRFNSQPYSQTPGHSDSWKEACNFVISKSFPLVDFGLSDNGHSICGTWLRISNIP
jgi:hypothetical protein